MQSEKKRMLCPEDGSELQTTDYKGVPIDECPRCHGRWFDRDELRKAKDRTDDDLRWLDFDPFGNEADRFTMPSKGKRCPRDSTQMNTLSYERSGVVIDRCPNCQGIWLSHGAFENIVRHLGRLLSTKQAAELRTDTLSQLVEVVAGPEGVISEVRDFFAVLKMLRLRLAVEHREIAEAADRIYQLSPLK